MNEDDFVKQEVRFDYRNWQLKAVVHSLPELIDLQVSAYIKDRTYNHGLHPLAFEDPWGPDLPPHPHPCDEAVLKDFNNARILLLLLLLPLIRLLIRLLLL
eukprot:403569-Heterocapsa_arctica.AAC.1